MAERDSSQPDIIADRIELRPALSSTGDVPVFLQQQNPPEPAPEEPPSPAAPEGDPEPPAEPDEAPAEEVPPVEPEAPPAEAKPDPRTVRAREQDARIARLEAMLAQSIEAMTARAQPTEPPPKAPEPVPTPAPEPRPTRAQFDDPEAYDAALVEWAAASATRRALEAHQAQLAEQAAAAKAVDDRATADRAAAEQAQLVWNAHQERRAKFIAAHPDYEDVVERATDKFLTNKPGTKPLVEAISRATDGPDVAYYLANNPAEESRITAMTDPWAVLVEVGKISAKLSQPKAPEVSRTPKPITPVSGNAMASGKDPAAMTAEEWARHTGRDKPQYRPFLASSGRPN